MVAGKVKMAMGLQKSPVPDPKPKSKPKPNPHPDSSPPLSRTFGSYFPRASAQVQPRPPDVTELLRLVEELRERLKTEILEQKLLKESVAILPVLESEICYKDSEIERSKRKIDCLETENERLRQETEILHMELSRQNSRFDERIKSLEAQISDLQKLNDGNSNHNKFMSSLKNFRKCSTSANSKQDNGVWKIEEIGIEIERPRLSRCDLDEIAETSRLLPRVPKPPPRPSSTTSSVCSSSSPTYDSISESSSTGWELAEISNIPPPPPLPSVKVSAPPPPPPPPPLKGFKPLQTKVRRVPEVVEFYHSLMRRDSKRDSCATGGGGGNAETPAPAAANKDMIGEIENRSSHLLAIKTDVETQGDFIKFLIKEIETAAFTDIEDVVLFVKWLDDELSYLVDERAVLKHFDWPERKADTLREAAFGYCDLKKLVSDVSLREAAFGYCDLKKLVSDVSSFRDAHRQPCVSSLKKMQAMFEKLEHGIYNVSRMRESAICRFKGFHIPMEWMLDTGHVISQIKLASVKLAMKYMKRVSAEMESIVGGPEEEELIVQAVRFAFRVHQFAGGFDVDTMRAFQELRDKAKSCHVQCQNQHEKYLSSRSSAY